MWSAKFLRYPIWTMWALALLMEMDPHKDSEKLYPRVRIEPTTFGWINKYWYWLKFYTWAIK